MTGTILALLLRHVLTGLGAVIVAKGYTDADTVTQVLGAFSTIGGVLWSVYQKHASGALTK